MTGTIRLDLPPGFVGTLDDLREPIEPGVDHAVLAGEHTVVVQTPCGEHRAQVSVSAGVPLKEKNLFDEVFVRFEQHLNAEGYRASKGNIVDACIIRVPRSLNSRAKNEQRRTRGRRTPPA